ncbi:MAG TPA: hypothetical protein VLR27_13795 [Acidimicrobiales bacterium]|nr:hypothetical protein [Acidimicrobiales bacterium]
MLTLILLVVLGGGAGLMAVWLIDARGLSRLLGRFAPGSLRPTRPADTTRTETPEPAAPEPALTSAATVATAYEPVESSFEPLPAPEPATRRDQKKVPAAYTAVEGTYREVARVPLWRKLVSLVVLLVILAVVGATIAALAGATFGLVAELVDGAVG